MTVISDKEYVSEEIICLLQIYCSNLDHNFSAKEIRFIKTKFGEDTYHKMLSLYSSKREFEVLDLILNHITHSNPSKSELGKLKESIISISLADGNICRSEQPFIQFYDKFIQHM